jgi:hypothetical protein
MAKRPNQRWVNKLKKSDLYNLDVAISKWMKLPEAEGFGKVQAANVVSAWAEGPRVNVELSDIDDDGSFLRLLFYFKKKFVGFRIVGVWTVRPREKIWPAEKPSIYDAKIDEELSQKAADIITGSPTKNSGSEAS